MNAFRVFYTDGTNYATSANGTAEEFYKYLMQFGGRITSENPVTGEETHRWIDRVEYEPKPGQTYMFKDFEGLDSPMVVTHVDETHVYYKFTDRANNVPFEYSYPMTRALWFENPNHRIYTGVIDDPDYLVFIPQPYNG